MAAQEPVRRPYLEGEMVFFDDKPFPPYLTHGVISATGELLHHTEIELPGPRLQHDMAITESCSILFDMSMMRDPELAGQRPLDRFS